MEINKNYLPVDQEGYEEKAIPDFLKNNNQFFILSLSGVNKADKVDNEAIQHILTQKTTAGAVDHATAEEIARRFNGNK